MPASYLAISVLARNARNAAIPAAWRLPALAGTPSDVTSIPRNSGILTEEELNITLNHSAQQIARKCSAGVWTAHSVTLAFCKAAALAHQLTNCLTVIDFDAALARAKYLDDYLRVHSRPLGPLHGLPISFKDCFSLAGHASTVGLTSRVSQHAQHSAALVTLLESAGAIIYCKTTTPQAQLSFDTDSPLWGRTVNPRNTALTAGGSSGGEAALIAMGGSVLGVGTDLGGSIRIPASCCGVYGFKPSAGRVPSSGTETLDAAEGLLRSTIGPLASSVEDLKFFMRVLERKAPWRVDPGVLKWELEMPQPRKLKYGFFAGASDGIVHPHPPIQALFTELQYALKGRGTVREVKLPSLPEVYTVVNGMFVHGGTESLFTALDETEEPLSPWLANVMKRSPAKDLASLHKLQARRQQLGKAILQELDKAGVDVLVVPTAGHAATKHDEYAGANYTAVWNLLDYPAGVVPGRSVTDFDLSCEMEMSSLGRWDNLNRALWAPDRRRVFLGAPIGVQVVARRGEEGLCLYAMGVVDEVLRNVRARL